MRIPKLGIANKQANVILGAGASRGASCFERAWVKSPLDSDFFEQIDRLKSRPTAQLLSDMAEFARDEFGASDGLLMEPFFTQLEALDEFHRALKIDRGPRVRAYQSQLYKFPEQLATLFRELASIAGSKPRKELCCKYHEDLALSLNAGDAIISFNYDCIIDAALRDKARKSWDAASGYGIQVDRGANYWHDHGGRGRVAKYPIKLLKVHGSLHWRRTQTENEVRLKKAPYAERSQKEGQRIIVPPTWNKRISEDEVLAAIWKNAREVLRTGPVLVIVGYSFPETDLLSQVLLRVATSEGGKSLTHLIIVNPDDGARRKARRVLKNALTPKSTIIELATWREFVRLLRP